jgi:cytoskeletal protein CcmA (bactofilin family)
MSEFVTAKTEGAENSCAFFGEGVTFKGSITAPERIVVHGTVEGDLVARDLLVGPTGTIKGNVKVDQADIQGKVLQNIEARVCLSLRKTGRIEGSAVYGDIEIEKGGVLAGEVSSIKGAGDAAKKADNAQRSTSAPIAFDTIRSAASEPKPDAMANKK